MGTDEEVKKDIWSWVKTIIPRSVILLVVLYVGTTIGGLKVYEILTTHEKLTEEYIQSVTSVFAIVFIAVTIVMIIICFILFIKKKDKIKHEKLPKGKIEAFIVEQDEPSRDSKFNIINQNVENTYWVLGVSLTSIVEHEKTLEKMAANNINIRLCMINPNIAADKLCLSNVQNNKCIFANLFEEIKKETVKKEDIILKCKDDYDDLLEIYNVLINVQHFSEYYATATDYKEKIRNSYDSLKRIREKIVQKCGENCLDLKVADSFIPMSLTIADASKETGRMIVEFHLPFTQYKVLFEINRKDNKELFKVFVDFYDIVWKRAQDNE